MDKIKLIYDAVGHTLTIWFDDPSKESVCEETTEEVVLMKDVAGRVIGLELLGYHRAENTLPFDVETVVIENP